jgi:glycosyltransferase involved in cell wall biosynthesis
MTTTQPLVSIITPTYNHEKFVSACIQSVLDQTYSNWEMIVVNDGSTDGTAREVHELAKTDSRIRFFDRENIGINRLSETYNFALQQSRGEYIAILEGDDFWVINKLELQVKAMMENPEVVLCWGRATSVIENQPAIYETHPKCEGKNLRYYNNSPTGVFFNIVFDDFPAPLTFLVRQEALNRIGQFLQVLPFPAVDLPTLLALTLTGPFLFLPNVLGSWRQHANQTTKNNSVQLLEGSMKIILGHYQSIPQNIREQLNFDLTFIHKNLESRKVVSYSRAGRFKLIRKLYKEARLDYRKSMLAGQPFTMFSWKIRSFVGLTLSYLKMDVEGLSKILGKKSYK